MLQNSQIKHINILSYINAHLVKHIHCEPNKVDNSTQITLID